MGTEIDVVIVSWNVAELLRGCLATLTMPETAALVGQVIVVDNASSDETLTMLAREYPQVKVLPNRENLGFTRANNQALALTSAPYILLLNPDTLLKEDALLLMLDALRAQPQVAVVGPRLVYGDGSPQPSRRRFPTLAMALAESTPVEWHLPNNPASQRYRMADIPDDRAQLVDWVTGACMLVRRAAMEQVGVFDERFFMYSEELDWCKRFTDSGWQVAYQPDAMVVHLEGASSSQASAARLVRFNTSKVLYHIKHHGRLRGETIRLALLGVFASEWLLEAAKWMLGHKRELRASRMRAYGGVLRSGLRHV